MDTGKAWGDPKFPLEDSPWAHWLQEIAQLPSDSPCWGSVEDFLSGVRQIAVEKERERAAARETLRKALDDLAHEYSAELRYFRCERPASWDVDRVSGRDLVSSIEEVSRLAEILTQARELRRQHCDTLEEDDQRQDALRALHDKIQAAYHKLNTLLSPAEKQPLPLLAGQPSSPSPLEDPTVADLGSAPEKSDPSLAEPAREEERALSQTRDAEIRIAEPPSPIPPAQALPTPAAQEMSVGAPCAHSQDFPAAEGRQGDGFAPSKGRLCELTDQELAHAILQANGPGDREGARSLLIEQQLRWLMAGQNLRAYIAARYLEEQGARPEQPGDPAGHQPLASWLCWFALLVSDPGASRLDFDIAEFIPHLSVLNRQPESHQRFFHAWLCSGLLEDQAPRCIQAAQHLSQDALRADWLDESPFDSFCVRHLVDPARRGQRPHVRVEESAESLRQRYHAEIKDASVIVNLRNYQNTYVTKYWLRLVGKEGPVRALLDQTQSGSFPQALPEPAELAASVDGWPRIEASYRTNILNRLSTFLNHLRAAASLHGTLQAQVQSNPSVLRSDQVMAALRDGEGLVKKLMVSRCPSLAGYRTLIGRLKKLTPGEGAS